MNNKIMVIPTFKRSLDLVFDNDFELDEEEIEQLIALLSKDENLMKAMKNLIQNVDQCGGGKSKLKKKLEDLVHSQTQSVEKIYESIIAEPKLITFIQEILLKRMI